MKHLFPKLRVWHNIGGAWSHRTVSLWGLPGMVRRGHVVPVAACFALDWRGHFLTIHTGRLYAGWQPPTALAWGQKVWRFFRYWGMQNAIPPVPPHWWKTRIHHATAWELASIGEQCTHPRRVGDTYGLSCANCGEVLEGFGYPAYFAPGDCHRHRFEPHPTPDDEGRTWEICIYCEAGRIAQPAEQIELPF